MDSRELGHITSDPSVYDAMGNHADCADKRKDTPPGEKSKCLAAYLLIFHTIS